MATKLNTAFAQFWVGIKVAWAVATPEQKRKLVNYGVVVTAGVLVVEGLKLALWIFACIGVYHTFFT